MKKHILHLLIVCYIGALFPLAAWSQSSDRAILKDKLYFYYVPQPNDASAGKVILNNEQIFNGNETGSFWTNPNMAESQALVRGLLRDQSGGGEPLLQEYASQIVQIVNKPVLVYLYDDMTPLNQTAKNKWKMCPDDTESPIFRAWPCANNQTIVDDAVIELERCLGNTPPARLDGKMAGYMHMGAYHMRRHGIGWTKGTFIHELVHTQDFSDSRVHLFWVNGRRLRYGADQKHFIDEAVPNRAMTYKEGIANTITLLYQNSDANSRFEWFKNNHGMRVEINPHPVGSGAGNLHPCTVASSPSEDAWLYNLIINAGATEQGRSADNAYAFFKVRDLPARFIIHNEFVLALIFSEYVHHINFRNFINSLKASNNNLLRVSGSGTAMLFENMCYAGLPEGETLASVSASGVGGRRTYLLPLAYADYFTAFRSSNKNEFKELFENMLPDSWIDLYWDTAKDQVRGSVSMANIQRSDLTSIAIALGVNSSQP
ncbi:hypothetical protein D770_05440 [Flammeovirgaceae bacterium 311]|nr:hypothetical protein D770_05440 [Flammeovirgaceae bacterium 311]